MAIRIYENPAPTSEPQPIARRTRGVIFDLDGPDDMQSFYTAEAPEQFRRAMPASADHWHGNISAKESFRRGTFGDDKYTRKVDEFLDTIDNNIHVEDEGDRRWHRRPVGYFPSVPDAIRNSPNSMWLKSDDFGDRSPLTIWVVTTMSGGCSNEDIAKRGAAITALLVKLQQVRPVELKLVSLYGENQRWPNQFIIVPMPSRPIMVSQISWCLCDPGWTRHTYNLWNPTYHGDGSWHGIFQHYRFNGNGEADPQYHKDMLKFLEPVGATPNDVLVPQLYLLDKCVSDPIGWVKEHLDRYSRSYQEAA